MLHLFKLFWFVVKELLFDSKEEYDFRSSKFNLRKMAAAITMMLSMLMNIWLLERFYVASTDYMDLRKETSGYAEKQAKSQDEIDRLTILLEDAEEKLRHRPLKPHPREKTTQRSN